MLNVMIHEYLGVSMAIAWKTATEELPPLLPLLQAMARDESA